ncbi:MAG: hypothetical protein LBJ94_03710 [Puniceicoccales bacterium]|jgi:hypothetical protein|nr:hypothetical protein [Puniceicoccales bacterium]
MMNKKILATAVSLACALATITIPCEGASSCLRWDKNSPLVQASDERESATGLKLFFANPEFVKIMPDLHFLIKRSYRSTKRDANQQYEAVHMLQHDEREVIPGTTHVWHCIRNFQGQQGTFVAPNMGWRVIKSFLSMLSGGSLVPEVDYPGFVAYRVDPGQDDDPIWIAVVLRGSQGEDFQPLSGMLGSSWVTNFSASAAKLPEDKFPFKGYVHSGYLNKILACEISMKASINEALESIGRDKFLKVRFIITGHSQGGGLGKIALPMVAKSFSYIYVYNQDGQHTGNQGEQGTEFKNSETSYFWGYFVSAPCISWGKATTDAFTKYIGRYNMIRHSAHGDVVPMMCLSNYYPLGVLALDTFYDVFCRSIRSEIAHCSISALFSELQNLFDPDKFDIDEENNVWTVRGDSRIKVYWTEMAKVAKISGSRKIFRHSPETVFKELLVLGFSALNPRGRERFPNLSTEFIEGLMKEWYSMHTIKGLVKHFALFEDVKLDEKRKEKVYMLANQMEEWLGNGEVFGLSKATSYANRLNAIGVAANSIRGLDSANFKKYANVIEGDTVVSSDTLSPIAGISAIAIAHFGSHSNFYGANLFDRCLPSKDINLSLRNGAELLRTKKENERCAFIYEEGLPKALMEICQGLDSFAEDD